VAGAGSLTNIDLAPAVALRLREFGKPTVVEKHVLNVEAVHRANARWKTSLGLPGNPIVIEDIGDSYLVRAQYVTGVVRVGDLDIEVVPKFLGEIDGSWQTVLWRILATVEGGLIEDRTTSATAVDAVTIPDLLADILLDAYSRGAARGLPRQYRTEAGAGAQLRGVLDTSRVGEWLARPWLIPQITDELNEDTSVARLLRWAAAVLERIVKSPSRARSLRTMLGALSDVGRTPPHLVDVNRIGLGPQHLALQAAVDVAVLLLEGRGIHHAAGAYEISGFLWNSDEVYERFVFWLCQRAASRIAGTVSKSEIKFGELVAGPGRRLSTTPDVVFRDSGRAVTAVMDAKYKTFGARPKSSDTYQILTGAHVLGCVRVGLTYPVATPTERTVWKVQSHLGGMAVALTALPLNLMQMADPDGADKLVARIATWLREPLFGGLAMGNEVSTAGPANT
jgi:5-methylcytosine-specific restriction endonuclease McrBC regulatory subunit McrC